MCTLRLIEKVHIHDIQAFNQSKHSSNFTNPNELKIEFLIINISHHEPIYLPFQLSLSLSLSLSFMRYEKLGCWVLVHARNVFFLIYVSCDEYILQGWLYCRSVLGFFRDHRCWKWIKWYWLVDLISPSKFQHCKITIRLCSQFSDTRAMCISSVIYVSKNSSSSNNSNSLGTCVNLLMVDPSLKTCFM